MSILKVENLAVPSPAKRSAQHGLVNNVNFDMPAGEVLAIIGPNGAGKSSLLKAIMGELAFNGTVSMPTISPIPNLRAKQLAILHQQNSLNFPFSVSEVVELGRTPHSTGKKEDQRIVAKALELMDISYLADRVYTELSGGEKQRTQLARVFCQLWEPAANTPTRLLILDEPLSALDLGHQHDIMRAVKQFASQGVSIIMVLHDINMAARYADRLLAMLCSEQIALGSPQDVITPEIMQTLFGLPVEILISPNTNTPVVIGA